MNRLVVLLSAVLCLTVGCTDNSTSPSTGTTDTFSGTLVQGAQNSYPFTVTTSGTVTVTATSVTPALTLGLGIGTLSGTTCVATSQNAAAQQSGTVTMSVTTAGTYCALVYDPGGLAQNVVYVITVAHP
jgi:hypothetical protein